MPWWTLVIRDSERGRAAVCGRLVEHTAVAVSLRTKAEANRAGVIVVRLPLDEPDPGARLRTITAETAIAKRGQLAASEQRLMVFLARSG